MSKVHYISPFRSDKNIGKALNDAIAQFTANEDDFIVHIDQDVLFLRPDSKQQLEQILLTTSFDLLGCVTNRLSMPHQVIEPMFDIYDMTEHIKIANYQHDNHYGKVIPTNDILAAFCLCFRVSTWRELGGFTDNCIQFDSIFSCDAINKGYKLGIMPGIYVFHLYRMWSDNAKFDIKHLMQ